MEFDEMQEAFRAMQPKGPSSAELVERSASVDRRSNGSPTRNSKRWAKIAPATT